MPKALALTLFALAVAALVGLGIYLWQASARVSQQIADKVHKLDSDLQHVVRQDEFLKVVQTDGFTCRVPQGARAEIHCDWAPEDPLRWLHPGNGIVIDAEFIDGRKLTAYKLQRTSN
jgi:hypothetical protein